MKKTILAIALLLSATFSYAATSLTVNSGVFVPPSSFSSGGIIVNSDGTSLTNVGAFAVVYATSGSLNITANVTTATNLLSQLSLASSVGTMSTSTFLNASINDADPGNLLATKSLYILVGNNQANILSSTAVILYNPSVVFPTQSAGNAVVGAINLRNDAGLLFGKTTAATGIAAPFAFTNGTQQLALATVAIPETSTTLLGALGALALMRRRRR